MTSEQLFNYITTTEEMYRGNCERAKARASFDRWYDRTVYGLKRFRAETNEKHEGLSEQELQDTARSLRSYYLSHIAEAE